MASEPCKRPSKRVVLVLCENDTAPSPIQLQLQIAEDTPPQEGVDHESMYVLWCSEEKSHLELLTSVLG